MARKITLPQTFLEKLAEIGKAGLSENKRIAIAKKAYLLQNENDIKLAVKMGYTYPMIAEAATFKLLETDIPKSCTMQTKEGEEKTLETKFKVGEIKQFCEPEDKA